MKLVTVDPGLDGGICTIDTDNSSLNVIRMPTHTVIDKPAVTVFGKDSSGNKVLIKSGANKGTHKRIIKSPAKSHRELDCIAISDILFTADLLVIESPAMSFGNSARSSATTNRNFGKLLAIAELSLTPVQQVPPRVWKKALNLGRDKAVAILFAEDLLSRSFLDINQKTFTTAEDGLGESVCIAYWYDKELLCLNKS